MRDATEPTSASRHYAVAYATHYTKGDLPLALQLYRKLIASYPSDQEADYCRMQIQNIINGVVPKQKMLDAQRELVLAHFKHSDH